MAGIFMGGFSASQTEKLTGVNQKVLHYWDKTEFLSPSVAQARGPGSRRVYSFRDLVALRVARELRDAGVSLQGLRQAVDYVKALEGVEQPLSECFLITDGKGEIYLRKGEDSLVSVLHSPGQGVFRFVINLGETVAELKKAVEEMAAA